MQSGLFSCWIAIASTNFRACCRILYFETRLVAPERLKIQFSLLLNLIFTDPPLPLLVLPLNVTAPEIAFQETVSLFDHPTNELHHHCCYHHKVVLPELLLIDISLILFISTGIGIFPLINETSLIGRLLTKNPDSIARETSQNNRPCCIWGQNLRLYTSNF